MMRVLSPVLLVAALVWQVPVLAHHSFAAQYDSNKTITLKGTVTKVEWANPHIYVYIDVKDDAGKVINWALEGGSPNQLYRAGWRKDSLKLGDAITVQGYLARDGSHLANMRQTTLADGSQVFNRQRDAATGQTERTAPPR